MSNKPSAFNPSSAEQLLDLLLDALLERQAVRQVQRETPGLDQPRPAPQPTTPSTAQQEPSIKPLRTERPPEQPVSKSDQARPKSARQAPKSRRRKPRPGEEGWTPPPRQPAMNLGRTMGRLLLVLVVLAVLVNIPVNRYGTSLARIMPDTAALVIRDGLVLKGSGPEIYVLEDNKLRWISSLEAFEFFDYHWEQVHTVEDRFLERFEKGRPIHVLLKCKGSPHIYALENGKKRWIKDILTFEAEGYVWDDVKQVSCSYLRGLPDGLPIPEDAGPPPEP